ncbi:hypothetical protein D3C80_1848510 [compost metagenome]
MAMVIRAPKPDPAVRIRASIPKAISRLNKATTGKDRLSTIAAKMVMSRKSSKEAS